MSGLRIEPAVARDLDAIRRLLVQAHLPEAGLLDQFPAAYVVARDGAEIVGVAGLETYGPVGLLRSVAVLPGLRGGGVGRALVADRLAVARARALDSVYLLTTSAADYFARLGFSAAPREEVPADLALSPELSGACPASAACMVLHLRG